MFLSLLVKRNKLITTLEEKKNSLTPKITTTTLCLLVTLHQLLDVEQHLGVPLRPVAAEHLQVAEEELEEPNHHLLLLQLLQPPSPKIRLVI